MSGIGRAIAGLAVAGIAYAGAGAMDDNTVRNDQGQITESGGLGVHQLRVGDCVRMPDGESNVVESMEGVPCADLHGYEVYDEFELAASTSFSQVPNKAEEGCFESFDDYVGIDYRDSRYTFVTLEPTKEGWRQGDYKVSCLLVDPLGDMLGSARGTAR